MLCLALKLASGIRSQHPAGKLEIRTVRTPVFNPESILEVVSSSTYHLQSAYIAQEFSYLLAIFVITHVRMSFAVSKSHRFAINRHFRLFFKIQKGEKTRQCFSRNALRIRCTTFPPVRCELHYGISQLQPFSQLYYTGAHRPSEHAKMLHFRSMVSCRLEAKIDNVLT